MSRDIFDRLMGIPGLKKLYPVYAKHKEILLYMLFGTVATVVSIGTFFLFDKVLDINELIANALSWVITVAVAYFTNRTWVFCSHTTGREARKELFGFYSGRLLTLGIEEGMLFVFVTLLCCNSMTVKIAAQVLVLAGNYVISKWFVFKKK